MKIETVSIDAIHTDPANLRKHGPKNLEAIAASLRKFGQQKPIIVNSDDIVLAGNGTFEAAKSLGWDRIKIIRTKLKGTDATAFAIADNRTAELAEWDEQPLAEMLRALQSEEDFEIESTGFTDEDVSAMIQRLGTDMIEDGAEAQDKTACDETEFCCPKCKHRWTGSPS